MKIKLAEAKNFIKEAFEELKIENENFEFGDVVKYSEDGKVGVVVKSDDEEAETIKVLDRETLEIADVNPEECEYYNGDEEVEDELEEEPIEESEDETEEDEIESDQIMVGDEVKLPDGRTGIVVAVEDAEFIADNEPIQGDETPAEDEEPEMIEEAEEDEFELEIEPKAEENEIGKNLVVRILVDDEEELFDANAVTKYESDLEDIDDEMDSMDVEPEGEEIVAPEEGELEDEMKVEALIMKDSSSKNFYINVDSDGKMPIISYGKPVKDYWTKYVNNKPVEIKPYQGQDRVWDYSNNTMLAMPNSGLKNWKGDSMPEYNGKIIEGK